MRRREGHTRRAYGHRATTREGRNRNEVQCFQARRSDLPRVRVARGESRCDCDRKPQQALGRPAGRSREHVRRAARVAVVGRVPGAHRSQHRVPADRLRWRDPGDHEPDGRLRRLRRAADAGSGHRVQGVPPDSLGTGWDIRDGQREDECTRPAEGHGSRSGGDLSRPDQELERSPDQEAEPGDHVPRPGNHSGLPLRRVRDVVQLHRLPLGGQPRIQEQGRRLDTASVPGRRRRSWLFGRRRRGQEHAGRDRLRRHRLRGHQPHPGDGRPERCGQVHDSGHQVDHGGVDCVAEDRREQRDAHREPPEVGAVGLPDQHLSPT